jgi:hypothetical protein
MIFPLTLLGDDQDQDYSIPIFVEELNEDGSDSHIKNIEANYKWVKQEILSIVL